jgi:hypothetical protein
MRGVSDWNFIYVAADAEWSGPGQAHSAAEIRMLHDRFPEDILLVVARIGPELVSGAVMFALAR